MNCCTGNCRQGRDCPNARTVTRAALGIAPLHQADGGHRFDRGFVFPIDTPEFLADDEPPTTPEGCGLMAYVAVGAITALAMLCAASTLWWGVPLQFPF